MKALKVYGWQGWRHESWPTSHNHCTREIVAARSKVVARRLAGPSAPSLTEISETGSTQEVRIATAKPGVVFWCPLDDSYRPGVVYVEAE